MFNSIIFPVLVQRSSAFVHSIIADVLRGTCKVMYKDGSVYQYTNVSRRALFNLIHNESVSLGFFVNNDLKFIDSKCAQLGTCELQYSIN